MAEPTTEQVYNDAIKTITDLDTLTSNEKVGVMWRLHHDTLAVMHYLRTATAQTYDLTPIKDELLHLEDPIAYTTLLGSYFMERILSTDLSAGNWGFTPPWPALAEWVEEDAGTR